MGHIETATTDHAFALREVPRQNETGPVLLLCIGYGSL